MKVLLVNGSPNKNGCTYTALREIQNTLAEESIDSEIFWIGKKAIGGCIACGQCSEKGKCVFDDKVNEFTAQAQEADGFIFGSPVYYSGVNGSLMSFMDRAFYSSGSQTPDPFSLKPAAAVVSARRAGTTSSIDQLNKYFMIRQMPVVSSRYWNMVHGNTPEEVLQDKEGLQIMRILARNMAWLLRSIQSQPAPAVEDEWKGMNFIR